MNYETVIGIEIHLELKTKTKMFSGAPVAVNVPANSCVSGIDIALPGTLPQLNKQAVKLSLMACKALNCEIDDLLLFDRKNYYYVDLTKGFQITQQFHPLGKNGSINISVDGKEKKIRINRIHLEEDTAKLFHHDDGTYMDFNRCSVPLVEIVSEADLRNGQEAMAYVEKLRSILYYLGVSDCKMEEGSLRCDVNISLRPYGYQGYGGRVEIKNLNSIANIAKAVDAEVARQTAALNNGEEIEQATYRFDENSKKTVLMRKKEGAVDYKYFPEPNIPPIRLSKEFINEAFQEIGELPEERFNRYQELGLSKQDSQLLVNNKALSDYFDKVCQYTEDYKGACNWLVQDYSGYLSKNRLEVETAVIKPEYWSELLQLLNDGSISSKQAKSVFEEMTTGKSPKAIVKEKGIEQVSDDEVISEIVKQVLNNNPQSIKDYREGKDRALGYLVGQVMKMSNGQVNPAKASALLKEALTKTEEV